MLQQLEKRTNGITTTVMMALSFLLQYILVGRMLPVFLNYSGGLPNLDQLFWYDGTVIEQLFSTLGEAGRAYYTQVMAVDFIFGIFYSLGYTMLLILIFRALKVKGPLNLLRFSPLLMLLFDYGENSLNLIHVNLYPGLISPLVLPAAICTFLKMAIGGVGLLTILLGLLALPVSFIRGRLKRSRAGE